MFNSDFDFELPEALMSSLEEATREIEDLTEMMAAVGTVLTFSSDYIAVADSISRGTEH